ncbi:MAG: hypothetical protein HYX79_09360 [Chloroflexi bacterium]|nr:hypothetical protein [Chloroflexota bacterium]
MLNVNSAEELNQILAECPFGPFSETEIYPLVDFEKGITQNKEAALAMLRK